MNNRLIRRDSGKGDSSAIPSAEMDILGEMARHNIRLMNRNDELIGEVARLRELLDRIVGEWDRGPWQTGYWPPMDAAIEDAREYKNTPG
jgi:hypothetical protein